MLRGHGSDRKITGRALDDAHGEAVNCNVTLNYCTVLLSLYALANGVAKLNTEKICLEITSKIIFAVFFLAIDQRFKM